MTVPHLNEPGKGKGLRRDFPGAVSTDEPWDVPLSEADRVDTVRCPTCQAPPGSPCTQPTDSSRRDVTWVHSARRALANGWT